MKKRHLLIFLTLLLVGLAGCGNNSSAPSYPENKKMVLDILKTDDGKKAIKEILENKEMRETVVFDQPAIKQTLQDSFKSEQGKKLWSELIRDPAFAGNLAQAMEHENQTLLKKMMKDPDYQKMMMDILKAPELQQQYLSLLRTEPFRKQIQTDMQEMLSSPTFKKTVTDAISEASKNQKKSQKDNQKDDQKE